MEVLNDMKKQSLVDGVSYRLAINTCARCNKVQEALELYDEMLQSNNVADHGLLRTLLWLLSKNYGYGTQALNLLECIKKLDTVCKPVRRLLIQEDYLYAIDACNSSQMFKESLDLYSELKQLESFKLDNHVLDSMLFTCHQTTNSDVATELYASILRNKNTEVNLSHYKLFLSIWLSAGKFETMHSCWMQMENETLFVDYTACILMMQCYKETNQYIKAGALLKNMQQSGIISGTLEPYILAAKSCIQCGEWKLALQILRAADDLKNIDLYNCVLAACNTAEEWDTIISLEAEIEQLTKNPDSAIHCNGDTIAYFILAHFHLKNDAKVLQLLQCPIVDTPLLAKIRNNFTLQ
ncbi:bifunctional Tetratricopeptide-like helical domain superfamily/Pentatricopeptide repeat [Babesia duncani]|nr:bifunctional Tetratricopeptide-like helical domain superfamily/Pentatricopeptide repeat [Babesia duncani]KAK2196364.1 bifunctional Tetratricopeptide-like helical domain superfamily/Pentatricopeptide repeat [Babesia duncani]